MNFSHNIAFLIILLILLGFHPTESHGQSFRHHKNPVEASKRTIYTVKSFQADQFHRLLNQLKLDNRILSTSDDKQLTVIRLDPNKFSKIHHLIESYDYRTSEPIEESFLSNYFPEVNAITAAKRKYPQYFEHNPTISVKENDADINDIDLLNRTEPSYLSSGKTKVHATDMATIIAGAGNTFSSSLGILPEATISTTDFFNLLPDPYFYFNQDQITIQNHSYGLNIEDYYGLEAEAYDRQVHQHPEIIHVFSSGNSGQESAIFSPYRTAEQASNFTGTFKHAKNVLTIGAIDSFSVPIPASSLGPAYDGRIKPELVAYGYNGTSDAAAITSGCAAVLVNSCSQNGVSPTSDVIRAVLVAGAEDVGVEGPDFKTGFGKINLLNSLDIVENRQIITESIAHGDTLFFDLNLDAECTKVALAWVDPPAEVDNDKALVNDLDLSILLPDQTVVLPFQMNYLPEELGSDNLADRGRDSINNTEMISFCASGEVTIRIIGREIKQDSQRFAIAYAHETDDQLAFIFPFKNANLEPEKNFPVLLSQDFQNKLPIIEFDQQADYEYPQDIRFKEEVQSVNGSATSDELFAETSFSVSQIPRIELLWQCQDSLGITWNSSDQDRYFLIYKLVGEKMAVIDSTEKAYFTLPNEENEYYAIQRVFAQGSRGPRSIAVNTSRLKGNCLYASFQGVLNGETIELTIELVEQPNYKQVSLEKQINGEWVKIEDLAPDKIQHFYIDFNTTLGANLYRLVFHFTNSQSASEQIEIFIAPNDDVLILPTLTTANQGINIIQNKFQPYTLQLMNASGQFVLSYALLSEFDFLTFEDIPVGMYFYSIWNESERIKSGKIIIAE